MLTTLPQQGGIEQAQDNWSPWLFQQFYVHMTANDYMSCPQLGKCFDPAQGFYSLYMIMTFPNHKPLLAFYTSKVQGISQLAKLIMADKALNVLLDWMVQAGGYWVVERFSLSLCVSYKQPSTAAGARRDLLQSEVPVKRNVDYAKKLSTKKSSGVESPVAAAFDRLNLNLLYWFWRILACLAAVIVQKRHSLWYGRAQLALRQVSFLSGTTALKRKPCAMQSWRVPDRTLV